MEQPQNSAQKIKPAYQTQKTEIIRPTTATNPLLRDKPQVNKYSVQPLSIFLETSEQDLNLLVKNGLFQKYADKPQP
jgi:hypothetical protein